MTQTVMIGALALLSLAARPGAAAFSWKGLRGRGALAADLEPEVVAHTLAQVEDGWRSQVEAFDNCNAKQIGGEDCSVSNATFKKSCFTVVSAVVKASSGERDVVSEYMADVCGQSLLEGWRRDRCLSLASAVTSQMSANAYDARIGFNTDKFCGRFWTKFVEEERVHRTQEREAREAEERERSEEAKRQYEEEQAEAATAAKAAEEAAAEQKRVEEERAKAEAAEAQKKAEEAQKRAQGQDGVRADALETLERTGRRLAEAEAEASNATATVENTTEVQASNATAAVENATEASNATAAAETATEASNATASVENTTEVEASNGTAAVENATEVEASNGTAVVENATEAEARNSSTVADPGNATEANATVLAARAAPAANVSATA